MTISRIRARPRLWQGLLALGVLLASACGSDGGGGDAGGPALRLSAAFDIDGTLTSDPGDFFGPPRPDAVRTVELLLDKGYDVFLVTARPPLLEDFTRNWLRDQGFPEVPLFLAPDLAATLAPTVNHCLAVFGPDRVVFGGDWPVCTLVASYREWATALREIIAHRPEAEQRKLLHDNAARFYGV